MGASVQSDHVVGARFRRHPLRERRGEDVPGNWKLRFKSMYEVLSTSMFFLPALAILSAIVLAFAVSMLDSYLSDKGYDPPVLLRTTVDSARSVLSTVAAATISFAGTAFSVSLLVLQLGSSQYSPRILHTLFKDPFNRRIVAFVVGTFTYCLIVMRSVDAGTEEDDSVVIPNVSVSVSVILGILSVLFIVAFIDHSASTMDVSTLLERITRDTITQIHRSWDEDDTNNQHEEEYDNSCDTDESKAIEDLQETSTTKIDVGLDDADNHSANEENEDNPKRPASKKGEESKAEALNNCHVVRFCASGWVQEIDLSSLAQLVPSNGYIKLHTLEGRYAIPGTAICSVYPKPTASNEESASNTGTNKKIHVGEEQGEVEDVGLLTDFDGMVFDTVVLGLSRTSRNDPTYGLRQLVDVVLRALSPGVNDPTTAQDGIFHVAAVVAEFLHRVPPPAVVETKDGTNGRLILNEQNDYDSIVRLGFDEARVCASSSPTVALYILEALRLIRDSLISAGRPKRAPEIERQARLVEEGILNSRHLKEDEDFIAKARRSRFSDKPQDGSKATLNPIKFWDPRIKQ